MVKYKTEAAEGGGLVEELSAQSRLDQETIRGLRDNIEELRQTAQTDKVCVVCVCVIKPWLVGVKCIDPLIFNLQVSEL